MGYAVGIQRFCNINANFGAYTTMVLLVIDFNTAHGHLCGTIWILFGYFYKKY